MSLIEAVADRENPFLSRRELVCDFAGLAGRLKKLEAVEMVTKQFKLDGKTVIPIRLRTHVGRPVVTGTFYVYDDESLARRHVDPTVFARLEKVRAAEAEKAKEAEGAAGDAGGSPDAAEAPAADKDPGEKPAEARG